MNERERSRVCELIRDEFRAKRLALRAEPTYAEVLSEVSAVVKRLGISRDVIKFEKASRDKDEASKKLIAAVAKASGKNADRCSCSSRDWKDGLDKLARKSIEERKNAARKIADLESSERKIIASVAAATSDLEVRNALKQAGLL